MSLPEISNEQKLTYIYYTLKAQEARRKRAAVYRWFKWLIIVTLVYFIASYPSQIFSKVSELIRPIVMDQAQTLLDENRAGISKSLNVLMKSIAELLTENATNPANIQLQNQGIAPISTGTTAKTGSTIQVKAIPAKKK